MDIKQKRISNFKDIYVMVKEFFCYRQKAVTPLSKSALADIFISLLPCAIFGCLLFGFRAVLVLALSVVLSVGADCLCDVIFKKGFKINYSAALSGLLMGLVLSSVLNIWLVVAVVLLATLLRKTVFKDKSLMFTTPSLLARGLLAILFIGQFGTYVIPFLNTEIYLPVETFYHSISFVGSAKMYFFGLHGGNIGETSVLLILVGGIYLMLRRIINPIIPVSFIITTAVLSLALGQNLAVSLLGSGLFFASVFMTLGYNFMAAARYKKLLYGIVCGALTVLLRFVFKTEAVLLAVVIADFVFYCITRHNIKKMINFVKKPNFKKLLHEISKAFSV